MAAPTSPTLVLPPSRLPAFSPFRPPFRPFALPPADAPAHDDRYNIGIGITRVVEPLLLCDDTDLGAAMRLLTKPRAPSPTWSRPAGAAAGIESSIALEEDALFKVASDVSLPSRVTRELQALA